MLEQRIKLGGFGIGGGEDAVPLAEGVGDLKEAGTARGDGPGLRAEVAEVAREQGAAVGVEGIAAEIAIAVVLVGVKGRVAAVMDLAEVAVELINAVGARAEHGARGVVVASVERAGDDGGIDHGVDRVAVLPGEDVARDPEDAIAGLRGAPDGRLADRKCKERVGVATGRGRAGGTTPVTGELVNVGADGVPFRPRRLMGVVTTKRLARLRPATAAVSSSRKRISRMLRMRRRHVARQTDENRCELPLQRGQIVKRQKEAVSHEAEGAGDDLRSRLLSAASQLLSRGGREAVTTRAVAEAAGVQPPVLYRNFKDKDAMLDALAEYGFLAYIAEKRDAATEGDPVETLRSGWDLHVEFGLSRPELYLLMYAHPRPGGTSSPAAELSFAMLRQHVARVAQAGRLRVAEERAVALFHAAAVGVVLVLLNTPAEARDMAISHIARDSTLAAIADLPPAVSGTPERTAAITLRAALEREGPFSLGERLLLREWLDRLAV